MNNLKNLKKNIASFLIIIWSFLIPSLLFLLVYDGFAQKNSTYLLGDLKVVLCCVFLLPIFIVFNILLCVDLYRINKDLKSNSINKDTFTITKISNRYTFLMYNGTMDKRLDYQTETYVYMCGHNTYGEKVKLRVFPNVLDSKANICGRIYEIEYYPNSKIATKMTRIRSTNQGTVL